MLGAAGCLAVADSSTLWRLGTLTRYRTCVCACARCNAGFRPCMLYSRLCILLVQCYLICAQNQARLSI